MRTNRPPQSSAPWSPPSDKIEPILRDINVSHRSYLAARNHALHRRAAAPGKQWHERPPKNLLRSQADSERHPELRRGDAGALSRRPAVARGIRKTRPDRCPYRSGHRPVTTRQETDRTPGDALRLPSLVLPISQRLCVCALPGVNSEKSGQEDFRALPAGQ